MKAFLRTYFLLLIIHLPGIIFGQADFTANQTEGCDSLKVYLSLDYSTIDTNNIRTISWELNDHVISSKIQPDSIKLYASDTTRYTVKLVINGSRQQLKVNYLKVYRTYRFGIFAQETNNLTMSFTPDLKRGFDYSQIFNYTWFIDDVPVQSSKSQNLVHEFTDTGTYHVRLIVANSFGCQSRTNKAFKVTGKYNFPNILYPNNDEYILFQYDGETPVLFQVFTRTGVKIYESKAPSIQWNGINMYGKKLNTGVYYYTITADNNSYNHAGFIHIYSN